MWEYRVSWRDSAPSWWDLAWTNGTRALDRVRLAPETRVDTYWIIDRRADLGVKLGHDDAAELAFRLRAEYVGRRAWRRPGLRHLPRRSRDRYLGRDAEAELAAEPPDPVKGIQQLLARAGVTWREHAVRKTRLQADAGALLRNVAAPTIERNCLAELVELRVEPNKPAWSLCFESAAPAAVAHQHTDGTFLVCGYPELLSR